MNREHAIGIFLVALLLGGVILLTRHSAATPAYASAPLQPYTNNHIKLVPLAEEPRRYQNKETRRIEYNQDGLPTLIEITRDFAIT